MLLPGQGPAGPMGAGPPDPMGAPAPDPMMATAGGQAAAMGKPDPNAILMFVMQMMGPGATEEAARALLMQVATGQVSGPAPGLEPTMPIGGDSPMGPGPMGPGPMGPGPMGPPPGQGPELVDPVLPGMGSPGGGPPGLGPLPGRR